jgi:ATP-dependent DNA helicase RecQ
VRKDGTKYERTPVSWRPDRPRVDAVTATRWQELSRMAAFVRTDGCLMAFIRGELDDPADEPCGRCANCTAPFARSDADPAMVEEALRFLRRAYRPILPRKRWPERFDGRRIPIPVEHQLVEGRALSVYEDAGWGQLVKSGKYGAGGFDDRLVEAVAEMLANHWKPEVSPTWVTAIPSLRAPDLVPGFAKRLAVRLSLPYRDALVKAADMPPQKKMENSYHQARNALASFRVIPEAVVPQPVFLIDDMVDSRWSLTACGVLLREASCGRVVPLALAETAKGTQT